MSKQLIIKKCLKCGAMVKVFKDCTCGNCGIRCCGEEMKVLEPNTSDGAKEKHVPVYEIIDGRICASVNHVMDEDHFIEWISIVTPEKEVTKYFKPGDELKVCAKYIENNTIIYSYCNKHGLWEIEA